MTSVLANMPCISAMGEMRRIRGCGTPLVRSAVMRMFLRFLHISEEQEQRDGNLKAFPDSYNRFRNLAVRE